MSLACLAKKKKKLNEILFVLKRVFSHGSLRLYFPTVLILKNRGLPLDSQTGPQFLLHLYLFTLELEAPLSNCVNSKKSWFPIEFPNGISMHSPFKPFTMFRVELCSDVHVLAKWGFFVWD